MPTRHQLGRLCSLGLLQPPAACLASSRAHGRLSHAGLRAKGTESVHGGRPLLVGWHLPQVLLPRLAAFSPISLGGPWTPLSCEPRSLRVLLNGSVMFGDMGQSKQLPPMGQPMGIQTRWRPSHAHVKADMNGWPTGQALHRTGA